MVGTSITITKVGNGAVDMTLYLNESGGATNFNLPFGGGYKFSVSGNATDGTNTTVKAKFLLKDGTTSTVTSAVIGTGAFSVTLTSPVDALLCFIYLNRGAPGVGYTSTFSNLSVSRITDDSPRNLLVIKDKYEETQTVEYIECLMRTKSYDYQAPTVRKRLFWWAIDAKTNQGVTTRTIPISKAAPVTWGDLSAYTHAQLSFGTWGSPLSFLNPTLIIHDEHDVSNSATENGRVTIKNDKGLRFRQLSFEVTMLTYGNANTGPAKLFSLTSYVLPKEKVSSPVS